MTNTKPITISEIERKLDDLELRMQVLAERLETDANEMRTLIEHHVETLRELVKGINGHSH